MSSSSKTQKNLKYFGLLTANEVLVYTGTQKYILKLAYGNRHGKNLPVLVEYNPKTTKWIVYEGLFVTSILNEYYEVREVAELT